MSHALKFAGVSQERIDGKPLQFGTGVSEVAEGPWPKSKVLVHKKIVFHMCDECRSRKRNVAATNRAEAKRLVEKEQNRIEKLRKQSVRSLRGEHTLQVVKCTGKDNVFKLEFRITHAPTRREVGRKVFYALDFTQSRADALSRVKAVLGAICGIAVGAQAELDEQITSQFCSEATAGKGLKLAGRLVDYGVISGYGTYGFKPAK